jgi:hypothetical protein
MSQKNSRANKALRRQQKTSKPRVMPQEMYASSRPRLACADHRMLGSAVGALMLAFGGYQR